MAITINIIDTIVFNLLPVFFTFKFAPQPQWYVTSFLILKLRFSDNLILIMRVDASEKQLNKASYKVEQLKVITEVTKFDTEFVHFKACKLRAPRI